MIKKRVIFVLVLILLSIFVYADLPDRGRVDYADTSKWTADDYATADYSKVTDWANFDQTKVPAERIADIPVDKIDVTKVVDKSKLTSSQLAYNKNINKINNWNDLNKGSLNNALSDLSGTTVELAPSTETKGIFENGKLTLDNADYIRINDLDFNKIGNSEFDFKNKRLESLKININEDNTRYDITNYLKHDNSIFINPDEFIDSDKDGLSDKFEAENNLNSNSTDTDNDGLSDYDEVMKYPTQADKKNSYSGKNWTNDKEFIEYLVKNPFTLEEIRNLRIESNPFRDFDNDGISDIAEIKYILDWSNYDIDNDGYSDGYEVVRGMNPREKNLLRKIDFKGECVDCFFEIKGNKGSAFEIQFISDNKIIFDLENANLSIAGKGDFSLDFYKNENSTGKQTAEIEKTTDGYLIKTNGLNSRANFEDYKEYVLSYGATKYLFNIKDGFNFIFSKGLFSYQQQFKEEDEIGLSYGVVAENYTLVIDKENKRTAFEEFKKNYTNIKNSGYISLIEHKIYLKGIAEYYRYGANLISTTEINGKKSFYFEETDYLMHKIYEGFDYENVFDVTLDSDNMFIDIFLVINKLENKRLTYKLHFDDMFIYEIGDGNVSKRYGNWEYKNTPVVIKSFKTNTHQNEITFENGIARQKGNTNINFYSKADGASSTLAVELKEYGKNFEFCKKYEEEYFKDKHGINNTIASSLGILGIFIIIPYQILRKRKSQISIFLIFAVLILLFVLFAFLIPYMKMIFKPVDSGTAYIYMSNCYSDAFKCSLYRMGLNGGFLTYPNENIHAERQAEDYISDSVLQCINSFKKPGQRLAAEKGVAKIYFGEKSLLEAEQKNIVSINNSMAEIERFGVGIDVRFKFLRNYEDEVKMSDALKINQNDFDLTVLDGKGIPIKLFEIGQKTIYIFEDSISKINGNVYKYMFLN